MSLPGTTRRRDGSAQQWRYPPDRRYRFAEASGWSRDAARLTERGRVRSQVAAAGLRIRRQTQSAMSAPRIEPRIPDAASSSPPPNR